MNRTSENGISYEIIEKKVIIHLKSRICENADELITSDLFRTVLRRLVKEVVNKKSHLSFILDKNNHDETEVDALTQTFLYLTKMPGDKVEQLVPQAKHFLRDRHLFAEFVEYFYDYWRNFDRYIVCDSTGDSLDKRPYRTFNATIEHLTQLIRGIYRDILENVTSTHPTIYRQVRSGAEIATISLPCDIPLPQGDYSQCSPIPVIRQILLYPPLILNPSMNKRSGEFVRVDDNPLSHCTINPREWLCYPAKVGNLTIMVYFHMMFAELGFSLSNLFELASDEDLCSKPDAVYFFGVPGMTLDTTYGTPAVFFDDEEQEIMVAAVPGRPEFGYFGYLKKMVLTLHNIIMMKKGILPFHGALVKLGYKDKQEKTFLIIGDTGAGKSETIEAFRDMNSDDISDLVIIADDMGSIDIASTGAITGYGTEIGAFLRLDDLNPGYAFGHLDRGIIMSPTETNARIIIPITNFETVVQGHPVDYVLYANNYEEIDNEHPLIERFETSSQALRIFREGSVMSKGTTTSTGITHSYFANIFGPPQYKQLHEQLAQRYFEAFFKQGVFVGQIRTRLGIPGHEKSGPKEAAEALFSVIS